MPMRIRPKSSLMVSSKIFNSISKSRKFSSNDNWWHSSSLFLYKSIGTVFLLDRQSNLDITKSTELRAIINYRRLHPLRCSFHKKISAISSFDNFDDPNAKELVQTTGKNWVRSSEFLVFEISDTNKSSESTKDDKCQQGSNIPADIIIIETKLSNRSFAIRYTRGIVSHIGARQYQTL